MSVRNTMTRIEDRIAEIERRIQKAGAVDDGNKAELLNLLGNLKAEIAQLSHTHGPQAQIIATLAGASTAEVTAGEQRNPQRIQESINELAASVAEFENSHPTLVQVVNRICVTLANIGI